jgi:hypothetical protein
MLVGSGHSRPSTPSTILRKAKPARDGAEPIYLQGYITGDEAYRQA